MLIRQIISSSEAHKYFVTILYHDMWMYILYCTCKNALIAKSWNTVDYISIYSCNDIFKPSTCYFDPIVSKENYESAQN